MIHWTARHLNIDRKWIAKEEILIANDHGKNGEKPLSEELDDGLFEFFQKEWGNGLAVMNKMLSDESEKIARSLGITDFKASNLHIKRWKNRFNMSEQKGTNKTQKQISLRFFKKIALC